MSQTPTWAKQVTPQSHHAGKNKCVSKHNICHQQNKNGHIKCCLNGLLYRVTGKEQSLCLKHNFKQMAKQSHQTVVSIFWMWMLKPYMPWTAYIHTCIYTKQWYSKAHTFADHLEFAITIALIQNTQEIKRTLFNWTKQDKIWTFSRKSSFSSYVQQKNKQFNLSCASWMWEAGRRKRARDWPTFKKYFFTAITIWCDFCSL